ncbi:MAG TPA: GspH/FimT family pseudopilin [Gallionellaceae bacterium]|nr:GspH/FimT family pseudopilin [Gallionellaceae bacterium]
MNATTAIIPASGKARGFTLIELMITIAVAIILAGIGLPSFRSMIASERMSNESFDIVAMLTLTRSEAIKRNATVTSTPNTNNWKQGWVITSTFNGNPVTINTKDALSGSDITITCFQGTSQAACGAIAYGPSGRLDPNTTPQAPSIQIISTSLPASGGQNARCISIDLSGQPRTKKGTC